MPDYQATKRLNHQTTKPPISSFPGRINKNRLKLSRFFYENDSVLSRLILLEVFAFLVFAGKGDCHSWRVLSKSTKLTDTICNETSSKILYV